VAASLASVLSIEDLDLIPTTLEGRRTILTILVRP
jgi:hypothetical protein